MTTSIGYREFDEAQYLSLQVGLLKVKGSSKQRAFLDALKDGEQFLNLIEEQVDTNDGKELPVFDGALTESSFKEPPADLEARMYDLWRDTPPATACRVSFWASVTLEHIRAGKITDTTWLAANGRITESGEERVDHALSLPVNEDGNKRVDDCVRTVFLRMSGLPAARGNRSVFVNPSFGRGWWRERMVASILQRDDAAIESRTALLAVVRVNRQYWENLVTMIVSRGSVFGSVDVQAALINSLAKHLRQNPQTPLRTAATLAVALRRFSNLAASQEIGVLTFAEIGDIADDLLTRVQKAHSKP